MRRVPRWSVSAVVVSVGAVLLAESPAQASGGVLAMSPAPSAGVNAVIAAVVGLVAGGLTFYLRTRGRRGEDRD